jgi:hypothetical protein
MRSIGILHSLVKPVLTREAEIIILPRDKFKTHDRMSNDKKSGQGVGGSIDVRVPGDGGFSDGGNLKSERAVDPRKGSTTS